MLLALPCDFPNTILHYYDLEVKATNPHPSNLHVFFTHDQVDSNAHPYELAPGISSLYDVSYEYRC